ncbi:MAG TPA: hypothetical protein VGA99_06380 [bacterium]
MTLISLCMFPGNLRRIHDLIGSFHNFMQIEIDSLTEILWSVSPAAIPFERMKRKRQPINWL